MFLKTHLTDCNTELTESGLANLLDKTVADSELDCYGGQNLNESMYILDLEDNGFMQGDLIQGRVGESPFVLQIVKAKTFKHFLLFECKQIESVANNSLYYYEHLFQVAPTQPNRSDRKSNFASV